MIRYKFILTVILLTSLFTTTTQAQDSTTVDTLGKNKLFRNVQFKGKHYFVCEANPHQYRIDAYHKIEGKDEVYDFTALANNKKGKLLFLMNGGMFNPDLSPVGLFITDSKTTSEINIKQGSGNFYMQPNGVFLIDEKENPVIITSDEYTRQQYKPRIATQSGPMMVINRKINTAFNKGSANLNLRNGVGIDPKGHIIFIVSEDPVNFYELSELFRDQFGCSNALYLDGFVSDYFVPEFGKPAQSKQTLAIFLTVSKP